MWSGLLSSSHLDLDLVHCDCPAVSCFDSGSQVQGLCISSSVQISSNVSNICQIARQYPKLN